MIQRVLRSCWMPIRGWIHRLRDIRDHPHRLARGIAIGVIVGWMPIMGIQMYVAAGIAWLCRGNALAAAAAVWFTNPLTAVPLFWFTNRVGAIFVGGSIDIESLRSIMATFSGDGLAAGIRVLLDDAWGAFMAMWLGGALAAIPTAILAYAFTLRCATRLHQRRQVDCETVVTEQPGLSAAAADDRQREPRHHTDRAALEADGAP